MTTSVGSCLCGAIKFKITGQPFRIVNCHCDDCRKATGAAFATNVFFKEEQVIVTQGQPSVFEHQADSGNAMVKEFCANCGSQLFASGAMRPGVKSVKAGSLDNTDFVIPTINLYVSHALNCSHIDDELENYEGMPT